MRRPRSVWLLLAALLLAAPVGAGEFAEDPDPRVEQLRRHMETLFNRHAAAMIAEQPNQADGADVAMVIGTFVAFGVMGDADPAKALAFYRRAAEMGSPEAECALGNLYATGGDGPSGGVERDPARARSHYEKAAAAGSVRAMMTLGDMYAEGRNIEPDSKKALQYYLDAAKYGEPAALDKLEPVMRNARQWEEERPGRKANFPTGPEQLVNPTLAKRYKDRNAALDRLASRVYIDLNKRIAETAGPGSARN